MHAKDTDHAPVEAVGGTMESGPWPVDIDEIQVGETYERRVSGGQTKQVEITAIRQIVDAQGNETDGYVVSYTYTQ